MSLKNRSAERNREDGALTDDSKEGGSVVGRASSAAAKGGNAYAEAGSAQ